MMNLTIDQIRSVAIGAARVEELENGIHLYRFTKEQEDLYRERNADFYNKTFSTAGIRMEFVTNSTSLSMEVEVSSASSRKFFCHEIFVNKKLVGTLENQESNNGIFSGEFNLGEGEKTVRVYFPWSATSVIRRFALTDGATLTPVKKSKTMLIFGDSITHGYDALRPSWSYASLLTDALDAEARNKGIGGETFWSALAESSDDIDPDYITVAYGTNDWSHAAKDKFSADARAFYVALSRRNPRAKIFAITPIWRADYQKKTNMNGPFEWVADYLTEATADLPNVTVIRGMDLVPKRSDFFSDEYLHPNDVGFAHYFNNLFTEIKKEL